MAYPPPGFPGIASWQWQSMSRDQRIEATDPMYAAPEGGTKGASGGCSKGSAKGSSKGVPKGGGKGVTKGSSMGKSSGPYPKAAGAAPSVKAAPPSGEDPLQDLWDPISCQISEEQRLEQQKGKGKRTFGGSGVGSGAAASSQAQPGDSWSKQHKR